MRWSSMIAEAFSDTRTAALSPRGLACTAGSVVSEKGKFIHAGIQVQVRYELEWTVNCAAATAGAKKCNAPS
jgi:hypothetical protein